MGLGLIAAGLTQCQPACTPIPDGDRIGANAPPPAEETVPAPVETAAPVTVPTTAAPLPPPDINQFDGGIVYATLDCQGTLEFGFDAAAPAEYDTVTFQTLVEKLVNPTVINDVTPPFSKSRDFTFPLPFQSTHAGVWFDSGVIPNGLYDVGGNTSNGWVPMVFHDNDGLVADVTVNAPGPQTIRADFC
jgi:hypothetical protein